MEILRPLSRLFKRKEKPQKPMVSRFYTWEESYTGIFNQEELKWLR